MAKYRAEPIILDGMAVIRLTYADTGHHVDYFRTVEGVAGLLRIYGETLADVELIG